MNDKIKNGRMDTILPFFIALRFGRALYYFAGT